MEQFNAKFDDILTKKMQYVRDSVANSSVKKESKKMIDSHVITSVTPDVTDVTPNASTTRNVDKVDYMAKQTLSKIAAEQDRKYKSSKAYKNANNYGII